MDLLGKFLVNVRQASVVNLGGVRSVTTKVNLAYAKAVAGAQNSAHIVSTTNVMHNNY